MNRRKLSAFAAGVCAAIFGKLYPEYVLLPDTYEYIRMENNGQVKMGEEETQKEDYDSLQQLLTADSEQIVISSYFLEKLSDRGIISWKNVNWNKEDMP